MFLKLVPFLLCAVYSLSAGYVKQNLLLPFPITVDGVVQNTYLTLDSNWRWIHAAKGYANCFSGSSWDSSYCPDIETCSKNCVIDGVTDSDWKSVYGVSISGNAATLKYVTGPNAGSRLYIVSADKKSYQGFDMRGKEVSFTVDVSSLPCGLNGAVYFTEMPLVNSHSSGLDASFGINYGDAQCPKDIKYIGGKANMGAKGACSNEYDIWEANSRAQSIALHPCSIRGVYGCANDTECGVGAQRFKSVCDKNGADYNPNRHGLKNFYGIGPGFTVDTSKPFKVITQFPVDSTGKISKVIRSYQQNGVTIEGPTLNAASIIAAHKAFKETDRFTALGGFTTMSESFARNHILVLSLWDDTSVQMRWLDSVYPVGSAAPEDYRGPCSSHNNDPSYLRSTYPNSKVIYSDVQIKSLSGSTPPSPVPTPSPTPVPTPVPMPSPTPVPTAGKCASVFGQCGGSSWSGPTCCKQISCVKQSEHYSQCA